jgi:hypothetical protein
MRRRGSIAEVPELDGLSVRAAENTLLDAGLLPHRVTSGSGLACAGRHDAAVVRGQDPRPHTHMVTGGQVCFWCTSAGDDPPSGGGGGSWQPRGPRPLLPSGSKPM